MSPAEEICAAEDDEIFCYSITTDNDGNVIYSDLAGRFPIESYAGMNYYFVCYSYKCNYIMIRTMKKRRDTDIVTTFKHIYEDLKCKRHRRKTPHT